MSINGINGGYGNPGFTPGLIRPKGIEEAAPREVRRPDAETASALGVRGASESVPAEAPQGTDPALWSILTSDERSYFARARAMGPLTYGRGAPAGGAVSGVRLGGRVDVKV